MLEHNANHPAVTVGQWSPRRWDFPGEIDAQQSKRQNFPAHLFHPSRRATLGRASRLHEVQGGAGTRTRLLDPSCRFGQNIA